MPSTDIDGSPILILSRKEAAALHDMLRMPAPGVFKDELAIENKIEQFLKETDAPTNDTPPE